MMILTTFLYRVFPLPTAARQQQQQTPKPAATKELLFRVKTKINVTTQTAHHHHHLFPDFGHSTQLKLIVRLPAKRHSIGMMQWEKSGQKKSFSPPFGLEFKEELQQRFGEESGFSVQPL
jgi:hypothetical protein